MGKHMAINGSELKQNPFEQRHKNREVPKRLPRLENIYGLSAEATRLGSHLKCLF